MTKNKITEAVTSNDPQAKRWRSNMSAARMAYGIGEFRQAESLLARAHEVAHELSEKEFAVSATDIGIAAVWLAEGKGKEAEKRLAKVVAKLEGGGDNSLKELHAVALRFHADALANTGDEREAEKELLRSASILEQLGDDASVQLAYTLCDLCGVYVTQNRISEANKYVTRAMKIVSATLGPDSPEYVRADMIYQTCLPMPGDMRKESASDGIQRMQYGYGEKHPNIVRALDRYFKVLEQSGDSKGLEAARERFGLQPKV